MAALQLDSIIDFESSKLLFGKDLKQSLLRLRKSMLAANQEYDKLMPIEAAASAHEGKRAEVYPDESLRRTVRGRRQGRRYQ